ncbi:hypothetical protein QCA50_019607 [Cerrena zonata]|uniref:Uncharacterized protein n=1 Tax=Cerrena zonata TaxID=2478898 RepID=A0AAW0FBW0_9APHY
MSLALSTPVAEVEHHAHQHKRAVKYVTQVSTVVVGDGQTQTQAQANQGSNPTTLVTSSQQGKAAAASSTEKMKLLPQLKLLLVNLLVVKVKVNLVSTDVEKYAAEAKGITYSPYTKSESDLSSLDSAIKGSERGWDAIDTVSIGNELVNGGSNSASDVAQAVKKAKSWLKSNASSFSGSVVTVDTLVAVENNSGDLCDASDYLAVNSHPFWDGNVDPSDAGPWLKQQISDLQEKCGNNGKKVVITETGWPTKGDSFQKCQPSTKNQLAAIKSISETIGDQVIFFTTYNDYWKDAGNYDVEQYWGIFGDPSN